MAKSHRQKLVEYGFLAFAAIYIAWFMVRPFLQAVIEGRH